MSARQWIRSGVDYAPPLAFGLTFLATRDFQVATAVLVGACALALAVGFLVERRLAVLPLVAGVPAIVFGGLTLLLHDPSFVKMKVTFVNGGFAAALLGGMLLKKNPIRLLIGDQLQLSDADLNQLTLRYGLWFLACAIANEVVWRTQSDGTWVAFRTALLPAALAFSLAQVPFLMKRLKNPAQATPPEPPDPGF